MSYRGRTASMADNTYNYYEPMDQDEIESALNDEIAAQILEKERPSRNSVHIPKTNPDNNDNYDTLSFLDAYEVGGTKELEFQKEAPLSADVTDLMGDEEQLEWYKKVMRWT